MEEHQDSRGHSLISAWGPVALAVLLLSVALYVKGQTRVLDDQVKLKIRVVERYVCSQPAQPVDCSSIGLYRFMMSDGTIVGPFYVIPAPKDFVMDGRWARQND